MTIMNALQIRIVIVQIGVRKRASFQEALDFNIQRRPTMKSNKIIKNINEKNKLYLDYLLSIDDLRNKYIYIYDLVCKELDEKFEKNNYCDFQNNVCICQRNSKNRAHDSMGCCYTFRNSKLTGFPVDTKQCEYLVNGKCTQNSIACKLYTCSYLKRKKIKFEPNDFFLIKVFFNRKQKAYIKNAFFKSRDEIIDKLVKMNTKL